MAPEHYNDQVNLAIEVDHNLRRQIEQAAASHDLSVRDYVIAILERATTAEALGGTPENRGEWAQISARAFARDWQSDEDGVYDGSMSRLTLRPRARHPRLGRHPGNRVRPRLSA